MLQLIPQLLGFAGSIFKNRAEAKKLKISTKAKIDQAHANNEATVELNAQELAITSRQSWSSGWKDEYMMIVVSIPLISGFLGVLWFAFTGDPTLLNASKDMAAMLTSSSLEYNELLLVLIGAVFGIRQLNK